MNESIHKYFKVGTIQWMSFPPEKCGLLDSIKKVACDDFFDALEMTQIKDEELKKEAIKLLNQSHLKVCYGAQPRLLGPKLNPNDLDEEGRLAAEKTLIEAVDEAESYGASGIAFLAGKYDEAHKEEAYNMLLKTTRNVCAYAEKKNMMVELEVFDYDVDKAVLIGPAPLAARFAADVRTTCSNFGLVIDLSHFPILRESSQFVVRTLRPYITHIHIGNAVAKEGCEAYGDVHPRFGFENSANDTKELAEFFSVLKQEGFFNSKDPYVLSIEVKPWKDEDCDIVLANTKRVINRAWAIAE